jgi:integrase
MALTDTTLRNAKSKAKAYKIYAGEGLFLLVSPKGGKWWRFKFRVQGKEKQLSLGTYPDIGLKLARERCSQARKDMENGIDPALNRKAIKFAGPEDTTNSFEVVAREWLGKRSAIWAESHSSKIIRRLELDIFPWVGKRPIDEIKPPELLAALRRIENRGAVDTAHRALQNCGQIFRYAVATGRAERDCAADLRGALAPAKEGHFAAITEPKAIGSLLRAIDDYHGNVVTKCAMRLASLVFVRPGELRKAQWTEIDFKTSTWNIPAERMKMRTAHIVPLSIQAVEILQELHGLTGEGSYLFPSARTSKRPMSDNAILSAFRRMGIEKEEMTGHGFRAMARTVLDEVLHVRPDYIEHQLAHAVRDPNGRAYNRTAHLPERRKMMQQWADYLYELRQTK